MSTSRKTLEQELDELSLNKKDNFAKVLAHLKKAFDEWCLLNLSKSGYPEMKIGYMAFLMNIGSEGITNTELAKKIRVTKQAMSKTSKELERLNFIELRPNPKDARSSHILLTNYGLKMVVHARQRVNQLTKDYIKVIGEEKYKNAIDCMIAMTNFHKELADKGLNEG